MKSPNQSGFTLTELLVTMAIGMVTLGAVTTTFMSQSRFYNAQEQVNQMEQNARGALDVITRELKMAGYNPAGMSLTGVSGTSQLQIQADLNGNGELPPLDGNMVETITYAYDSLNRRIRRTAGTNSPETLAENIEQFTFVYYQADGVTETTTASEIRQVKITITAKTARPDPNYTSNSGYRTYQVRATITPVNLAL